MVINPWDYYHANGELREVLDMIGSGFFSPDEPGRFKPIVDNLLQHGDHYLLLADYAAYIACQSKVDAAYRNQEQWMRSAILNVANMGKFSSDRTISQYAEADLGCQAGTPCCAISLLDSNGIVCNIKWRKMRQSIFQGGSKPWPRKMHFTPSPAA